ncbi:MAG TPA: ECF-type sigma factor [Gemmata sp.]|jgi:RNA polymerase sigma factor (TIGR02999 family)|nr:ECF-type sigma factor [Gemmata sp.]
MSDLTQLLDDAAAGDRLAAAKLLPLVYDELRKLAAARMAAEPAGHTLQPTDLVHDVFLRLVGTADSARWANHKEFFSAAAEAMRRILIESARGKHRVKRGGRPNRLSLDPNQLPAPVIDLDQWIDLDLALTRFEAVDAQAAGLTKLRMFGGLSVEQAGEILGLSRANAFRKWTFAQAWLSAALADQSSRPSE